MIEQQDEAYQARIKLVVGLVDYWFHRKHPGWYGLDPDTMQPEMTEDEALAAMKEDAERLWGMTDEQLHTMMDATLNDLMGVSPLRNMLPHKSKMTFPIKVNRYIGR